MNNVLADVLACEVASHRHSARTGEIQTFGPLVAAYAGRGVPLDTAWHEGNRAATAAEWEGFEGFCAEHQLPAMVKLLSPALAAALPALYERGYRLSYLLHAYAHDLATLPALPNQNLVETTANAEAWAEVAAAGFGPDTLTVMQNVGASAGQLFWARQTGAKDWQASGAYTLREGVAAFHGAATRPEARGQGLQTALLAHRLHGAKREGASWASVFVSPESGSERNVQRAGFAMIGAQLCWVKST